MLTSTGISPWLPPLPPLKPPASAAVRVPSQMDSIGPVTTGHLINGATGQFVQMPNQQRSVMTVMLPMQSLPPGAVNMVSDMLEEGSEASRTYLSRLRDQDIRLFTGQMDDKLVVRGNCPVGQESEMAKAALTLLTRPIVDAANFNTLQAKMLANLQGFITNPDVMLSKAMAKRIYGQGHLFSLSPQELSQQVARQDLPTLMAHYKNMLQRVNASQVMMISSQPAQAQQQIINDAIQGNAWFQNPYGAVSTQESARLPDPRGIAAPVLVPNESLKRALVRTTWRVPDARDPDYPAYLLLQEILQGTSVGSFFQTLRTDHGLVYSVGQSEGHKLKQGLCYNVNLEVGFDKIGQAINDLGQVTQKLCQDRDLVSPALLSTMKRKALLSLRDQFQMPGGALNFYSDWLDQGVQPPDLRWIQSAIEQVSPESLQRVSNRIFNPTKGFQQVGVSAPKRVLQAWFPGQAN